MHHDLSLKISGFERVGQQPRHRVDQQGRELLSRGRNNRCVRAVESFEDSAEFGFSFSSSGDFRDGGVHSGQRTARASIQRNRNQPGVAGRYQGWLI